MSDNDGDESRPCKASERVKVIVRCRPLTAKETKAGNYSVVNVFAPRNAIQIVNPKSTKETDVKTFVFDAVYGGKSSQEEMYKESVEPFVESVMEGFNATVFAYGQTGAGKTYTMEGLEMDGHEKGLMPRSFQQIFDCIDSHPEDMFVVRCSYLQLYRDDVEDLLDDSGTKSCVIQVDLTGVYVKNLKLCECETAEKMHRLMKSGNRKRRTGKTSMNESSSRSHAIFIIHIQRTRVINGTSQTKVGKLNLVDLAGSERQSKSHSAGESMKEAVKVNLSLIVLGKVISALTSDKPSHIPYRESKLTKLLQDSLGGNSKTLMIANVGPASDNYVESLSTLVYADRAKMIKNKPITNELFRDAEINDLEEQNTRKSDLDLNTSALTGSQTLFPTYEPSLATNNKTIGADVEQEFKIYFVKEYEDQIRKLEAMQQDLQLWLNKEFDDSKGYEILLRVLSYERELHMGIMLIETLNHFIDEKFVNFDQEILERNKTFFTEIVNQYNTYVKTWIPKEMQRKLLLRYNTSIRNNGVGVSDGPHDRQRIRSSKSDVQPRSCDRNKPATKSAQSKGILHQEKPDLQNSSKPKHMVSNSYDEIAGECVSKKTAPKMEKVSMKEDLPTNETPISIPLPYFYGRKYMFGQRDSKFRDDISYRINACGIKQYYIGDKPLSDNSLTYLNLTKEYVKKPLFEYIGNNRFLWRESD